MWIRVQLFAALVAAAAFGQTPSAAGLLAKARAAYEANRAEEQHWNWITTEAGALLDSARREVKRFPEVEVESVIRNDGRRCNAVVAWGDGAAPYKVDADADTRCGGQDPTAPPLQIRALLESAKVTLTEPFTIAIHHDKARVHDATPEVRCTASIEGVVRLDPATLFPTHIEGKLVDTGCESVTVVELHDQGQPIKERSKRALFKGTGFRMEFAFQPDKYGAPGAGFWISIQQHWSAPVEKAAAIVIYDRRFLLRPMLKSGSWIRDMATTAQEFGAKSEVHFDTIAK